jgi:hypothetical protein
VASTIQPLLSKGKATADASGNVLLDAPASQEVLANLEELPVDRKDIADLNLTVTDQGKEIANLSTENGSLQTALTSEKASHKADNEANAKQITGLKADCRKSKLKWFFVGVVTGFVGRSFTKI